MIWYVAYTMENYHDAYILSDAIVLCKSRKNMHIY